MSSNLTVHHASFPLQDSAQETHIQTEAAPWPLDSLSPFATMFSMPGFQYRRSRWELSSAGGSTQVRHQQIGIANGRIWSDAQEATLPGAVFAQSLSAMAAQQQHLLAGALGMFGLLLGGSAPQTDHPWLTE